MQLASLETSRQRRIYEELRTALASRDLDMAAWAGRAVRTLARVLARRSVNFGRLVGWAAKGAGMEAAALARAVMTGRIAQHLGARAGAGVSAAADAAQGAWRFIATASRAIANNPGEAAPGVIGVILGFFAGSGGLDGDGGVPDLDFLAGIGAHRSIFTHSILAGAVLETSLLAASDLANLVIDCLPRNHDPLWDALQAQHGRIAGAFARGASRGIGYHLMVDACIQPAAYKDLPFEAQIELHQTLMAANAAAEVADAVARPRRGRGVDVGNKETR